jgi:hypothetical protein
MTESQGYRILSNAANHLYNLPNCSKEDCYAINIIDSLRRNMYFEVLRERDSQTR